MLASRFRRHVGMLTRDGDVRRQIDNMMRGDECFASDFSVSSRLTLSLSRRVQLSVILSSYNLVASFLFPSFAFLSLALSPP